MPAARLRAPRAIGTLTAALLAGFAAGCGASSAPVPAETAVAGVATEVAGARRWDGAATIRIAGVEGRATASCLVTDDPAGPRLHILEADVPLGGARVRVANTPDGLSLAWLDAGGVVATYATDAVPLAPDPADHPIDFGGVTLTRTEVGLDPDRPRELIVSGTLDCRDPSIPPPDQTAGHLTFTLDTGESWDASATCSWAQPPDVSAVTAVAGAFDAPVRIGRHDVVFSAWPEPKVNVDYGGTIYRVASTTRTSSVELAADASSGHTRFEDLSAGRILQAQRKLFGVRGPTKLSGDVSWTCERH